MGASPYSDRQGLLGGRLIVIGVVLLVGGVALGVGSVVIAMVDAFTGTQPGGTAQTVELSRNVSQSFMVTFACMPVALVGLALAVTGTILQLLRTRSGGAR